MIWLQIFRLASLLFTILCAIIVLGVAADLTAITEKYLDGYFAFGALAIADAVLTLFTLPIMLIIDLLRNGAFTSMIVVELSWLSVLWVLWLAAGATASDDLGSFWGTCDYRNSIVNQGCRESQAIAAFSFLAWIALLGYTISLLVMCIIEVTRGRQVWFNSVKNAWDPVTVTTTPPAVHEESKPAHPQAQYSYPPQGVPAAAPVSTDSPYPQV